jgi:type I restriction enzyme S subunit
MGDDLWAEWPFPDAIDFQEGPGILAKDFRDSGVPLIRLSGLDRGVSVLKGCNFLDPATVQQRWSHFALQEGDILLSTSASLGRIAVVGKEGIDAIAYTGIIRMRPRDDRVYAPFIRYLLEGPDFQRQAEMAGVGSVIRHFGPMHLRRMTVRIPPIEEQRAIACILGTLDDKIELNRRINQTLEGMARAIFESWFVDLDPVRAKAAGRQPPGLAPHILCNTQGSIRSIESNAPRHQTKGNRCWIGQDQLGAPACGNSAPLIPRTGWISRNRSDSRLR